MRRLVRFFFIVAAVYAAGLAGVLLYNRLGIGETETCHVVIPAAAAEVSVLNAGAAKDHLVFAEQADGSLLIDDQSAEAYASLYSDIAIRNDRACHWTSLEFKFGTTPYFQLVLHYLGATYLVYYAYIDRRSMQVVNSVGATHLQQLDDGWYRLVLAGANNRSGNRLARVQIYPRHGEASDTGSLLIRNAAFF